ncbi:phage head closure protein [Rossellomorea sp. DA94]|uniref:phage head closure protein n=1 Tax=Rossellomorea sp. DA94 TaxID=3038653 RepID=UPI0024492921|nr:phage head closure protein [Rossellomorea sp. DA94]WGG47683.1 phage head closure protein [Rossellomorea sp. DA94]
MNPGRFDKRITFQKYDENAVNENGFPVDESERYSDVKTVWAMIRTLKGSEFQQSNTTKAEMTSRFVIRYSAGNGLDSDMRILHKGKKYEIVSPLINDDEKNVTLTIVAKEVV